MNKVKVFHISLNRGETAKLPADTSGDLFLQCREGSAWLTVAADPQDYIVDRGEQMQLPRKPEEVLVQSLTEHLEIDVYRCA